MIENLDTKEETNNTNQGNAIELSNSSTGETSSNVTHINIGDRGFFNGLLNLDPDEFRNWLRNNSGVSISEILTGRETKLEAELRGHYNIELNERTIAERNILHYSIRRESLNLALTEVNDYLEKVKTKIAHQKTEKDKVENKQLLAWPISILFIIAAFAFMCADVYLVQDVLSAGLGMNDITAWFFGIAIAFTGFLIKPLFHTFIYKPYIERGKKWGYIISLSVVTIACMATLGIFGFVRSKSENVKVQVKSLREENEARDKIVPFDEKQKVLNDTLNKINKKDINSLNDDLNKSSEIVLVFILSGILFACASAILLTLGSEAEEVNRRRWSMNKRIKKLEQIERYHNLGSTQGLKKKQKWVNEKAVIPVGTITEEEVQKKRMQLKFRKTHYHLYVHPKIEMDQEIAKLKLMILHQENALSRLNPDGLAIKLEDINRAIGEMIAKEYEFAMNKSISNYNDGYNRGNKYKFLGDLLVDKSEIELHYLEQIGQNDGKENTYENEYTPSKYNRRPFIQLRKNIAKNKFNNNEENFEN